MSNAVGVRSCGGKRKYGEWYVVGRQDHAGLPSDNEKRPSKADSESTYRTSRGDNFKSLFPRPTGDVQFPVEATMASIGRGVDPWLAASGVSSLRIGGIFGPICIVLFMVRSGN